MTKRPLAVTIIAWIYIAVGAAGFFYHVGDFDPHHPWGAIAIEAVRVLAIVLGIFLLRGANWARWGAILWMALHVYLGALISVRQLVVHAVFLLIFAYFLFRPSSKLYFSNT